MCFLFLLWGGESEQLILFTYVQRSILLRRHCFILLQTHICNRYNNTIHCDKHSKDDRIPSVFCDVQKT